MGVTVPDDAHASWTFAQIPDAVLYSTVSDRAIRLYAIIHKHTGMRDGAFPGRKRIAALLSTSLDSTDRAIRELEDAGFLVVTRRANQSSLYELPMTWGGRRSAEGGRMGAARWPQDSGQGGGTHAARVAAPMRPDLRSDLRETDLREKDLEIDHGAVHRVHRLLIQSLNVQSPPVGLAEQWLKTHDEQTIAAAIDVARENGAFNTKYVDKVLANPKRKQAAAKPYQPVEVDDSMFTDAEKREIAEAQARLAALGGSRD